MRKASGQTKLRTINLRLRQLHNLQLRKISVDLKICLVQRSLTRKLPKLPSCATLPVGRNCLPAVLEGQDG